MNRAPRPPDAKNPIIIPKRSPIANLLIKHCHNMLRHSGREHVLAYLRQRHWLIHGNSIVRKVLADCWDCKRRQGKVREQKMADLPENRVNPGEPPFSCDGVDYFGPFFVREKRSLSKRYGVIFTCLAIRAIHLEVAPTLDTNSFILALRRFTSRQDK